MKRTSSRLQEKRNKTNKEDHLQQTSTAGPSTRFAINFYDFANKTVFSLSFDSRIVDRETAALRVQNECKTTGNVIFWPPFTLDFLQELSSPRDATVIKSRRWNNFLESSKDFYYPFFVLEGIFLLFGLVYLSRRFPTSSTEDEAHPGCRVVRRRIVFTGEKTIYGSEIPANQATVSSLKTGHPPHRNVSV